MTDEQVENKEQTEVETSESKIEQPADEAKEESVPSKEVIKEQLSSANEEINNLKAQLDEVNNKKEAVFQKKQSVGSQIATKIKSVSEFKVKRNELTQKVLDLKKKRDELNKQINERVQEIKKLVGDKPLPKRRGKDNPNLLLKEIEKLEYRLETQPMGFQAEQKINKQIRDIRKKYDEQMKQFQGMEDVMQKSKEIDKLKREANDLHAQVTRMANDSQKHHELLIEYSKDIDNLKKEEEELYKTFLEHKKVYSELNARMKSKTGNVREIRNVERAEKAKARKKKQAEDEKTIKERAKEAEEKVKTKQKLTTEDLLALQSKLK